MLSSLFAFFMLEQMLVLESEGIIQVGNALNGV